MSSATAARSFSHCKPRCPADHDGPTCCQMVDSAHLDVAHLQIQMHPCSNEIRNGMMCTTLLSMSIILILILALVPWQVAFLVSWSTHLVTCATHLTSLAPPGDSSTPPPCTRSPSPRPSRRTQTHLTSHDTECPAAPHMALTPHGASTGSIDAHAATDSLGAAVSTTGGDHNVLSVAQCLVLVNFASWMHNALFPRDRCVAPLKFALFC